MRALSLLIAAASVLALSACEERTRPPGDALVCYHVVPQKDGSLKYNKLVSVPTMEACAGNLEAMRIKFLRMGGSQQEIYGAYQSNFLFLQNDGIYTADSAEGPRFIFLVRTGDGRLAVPGAMPMK